MTALSLDRRTLLTLGLGVAVGAALPMSAAAVGGRQLTASSWRLLSGRPIEVFGDGWRGSARVGGVSASGVRQASDRDFVGSLHSDIDLPSGGALIGLSHPELGSHALFVSRADDPRVWNFVVSDLDAAAGSGRTGPSAGWRS